MDNIKLEISRLNQSLGTLLNFRQKDGLIEGETDFGQFRISVHKEGLIRIRVVKNSFESDKSYVVIGKEIISDYTMIDEPYSISIITEKVKLKIDKSPVRFTFLTLDDRVISQDDPAFGTSWLGDTVTTYKKLQKDEKFVGLGEKTGPLNRRGRGYINWNTDMFAYGEETDPLYSTIPFYIGIHNNLSYGIYFNNTHRTQFNFGASNDRFSSFSADQGEMDYYFFSNDNIDGIIKDYTWLTGRMELPPLWSIGYQQCRYSYYPDKEVYTVADTFRDKDIPADVIVLDIHYMEKYKIFTWDDKRFPNPKALIQYLKEKGFKVVVICDPGIKIEEGYDAYESGVNENIFIKYPDGENYAGEVWPGLCNFPDFTLPRARKWWKDQMEFYTKDGIEGYWNDMNEIATWGNFLPELMEMDFDGDKKTMRAGRNIYGMQMARTSFESAKELLGKRPFILTRAGFSGIQRYSALWTGDNVASDEHMLLGVRLLNSLGISGVSFAGYDAGGFAGNSSEGLFARWIQLASFSPFFRGHSMINSRDSEPWSFGEEVEEIARNYIKLRYKLMPYLYSLFYESSQNGAPVVRSLVFDYSHDENIYKEEFENQYKFGRSIMVAPVDSKQRFKKVYFPEGEWYELFSDKKINAGNHAVECGIEQLPVFVKESSIFPVCPQIGSNTKELGDIIEIHIYKGKSANKFTLYLDDGESYKHLEGEYYKREISFNPDKSLIELSETEGEYEPSFNEMRIVLHGFEENVFSVNGEKLESRNRPYKFVEPISCFDPVGEETGIHMIIDSVKIIKLKNISNSYLIKY